MNAAVHQTSDRTSSIASHVREAGYAIATGVASRALIDQLLNHCPATPAAGLRDLLFVAPAFRTLSDLPAVRALVAAVLGSPGFVTRAVLFDKPPDANWSLGFHQDVVVAVAERIDTPGWGPWSVKAGIPHVRPPAAVLHEMITVRIHLDDCGPDNGPLEVIPRSHTDGFLDDAQLEHRIAAGPVIRCACRAGDAVLIRPLLLHGSRKSQAPTHRRVVHLEFAATALPAPLRWRSDTQ